jgi:hypothetical protein
MADKNSKQQNPSPRQNKADKEAQKGKEDLTGSAVSNSQTGLRKLSKEEEKQFQEARKSRRTELEELDDAELKERFKFATALEAADDAQREDLIEAIVDATVERPAPKLANHDDDDRVKNADPKQRQFGNKNKEIAIPAEITKHKDWQNQVVVRQASTRAENGGFYEVPNTAIIQTYDVDTFNRMKEQKFFSEAGLDVKILHEPKGVSKD